MKKVTPIKIITLGVIIGVIIGSITHNLLKWIVIGVISGVIVGSVLKNYKSKDITNPNSNV